MPTMVQEAESAWFPTTNPKTTPAFDALTGDVLVACSAHNNNIAGATTVTISNSGTALVWDLQQVVTTNTFPRVTIWTTVLLDDIAAMTVSFTRNTTAGNFGGNVLTIRDTLGVGNSSSTTGTGAPSLDLSTSADNSMIIVINADNNAVDGSSRAWRAGAGSITELTYVLTGGSYGVYMGYHDDAGGAGVQTVGLTAPTGENYAIATIEMLLPVPVIPEQTDLITYRGAR